MSLIFITLGLLFLALIGFFIMLKIARGLAVPYLIYALLIVALFFVGIALPQLSPMV